MTGVQAVTGGQGSGTLRPDVLFDHAATLEAIAACLTAAQVCADVTEGRLRAADQARVGWEGRMRDGFDRAEAVLLAEIDHGRAQLRQVADLLEDLAERAQTLRAAVDRHNDAVLAARAASS